MALIDWMLSLSPRQRLQALFDSATTTARLFPVNGPTESLEVLEVLHRHDVEFIVVDMTAAGESLA